MLNPTSLDTMTIPVVAFVIAGTYGVLATLLAASFFNKNVDTASSIAVEFIKCTTLNCLFLPFSGLYISLYLLAMSGLNFIHPLLQATALLGLVLGGPISAVLFAAATLGLLVAIKLCQLAHRFFSNLSKETEYPKHMHFQENPVPASKIPSRTSNQPAPTSSAKMTPEESASPHSLPAHG